MSDGKSISEYLEELKTPLRSPSGIKEKTWMDRLWDELPISSYYWKTPQEQASLRQKEISDVFSALTGVESEEDILVRRKSIYDDMVAQSDILNTDRGQEYLEFIKEGKTLVPYFTNEEIKRFQGEINRAQNLAYTGGITQGQEATPTWLGMPSMPVGQRAGEEAQSKFTAEWLGPLAIPGSMFPSPLRWFRGLSKLQPETTIGKVAQKAGQTALAPIAAVEKAPELAVKAVSKPGTSLIKKLLELPERTATHDAAQMKIIHNLAREKGLVTASGKFGQKYRNFLEAYTGKKSAAQLSRQEADYVIQALEGLTKNAQGKLKIPKKFDIVPRQFMKDIPALEDIGILDVIRQKTQVLKYKFGSWGREFVDELLSSELKYNLDLQAFRKTSDDMLKLIGKNPQSKTRIFEALENPLQTHILDSNEQVVYKYFRQFFDDWANRLNLSTSQRRKNYITHIFEEQIKREIEQGKTLPMEMMSALDYGAAKTTFMPFLQQRLGKNVGLKLDPFEAASIYEYYALKKLYYEPFVQKLSAYSRVLRDVKPFHARYLTDISKRLTGRPGYYDTLLNKTISNLAKGLSKTPLVGRTIPERMLNLSSRGNFAALVAYNMNSLLYMTWLGFRPVSAIRNLSQQLLAVADKGVINFAKGMRLRATSEGKNALKESVVYQGRLLGRPVAGMEEEALRKLPRKLQDWSLGLFKWADRQNVADSFLAGYAEGKSLGLPRNWCIKLGDEAAMNTQYLYTKMARSIFEDSAMGRFLTPFTSWPRNFGELMIKWIQGRPSLVLQEFERQTGKSVIKPTNWLTRRKELMTYGAILSAAYMAEGLTDIKATQYTGWTSVNSLARMLGGDIPAITVPGAIAGIVGGGLTGDEQLLKESWNTIRPDKFVQIIRQLENIAEGKTDTASLFFYMERAKADEEERKSLWEETNKERKSLWDEEKKERKSLWD